jgi:hypothetical protein
VMLSRPCGVSTVAVWTCVMLVDSCTLQIISLSSLCRNS